MRIAYITPYFPPVTRGGAEISLQLLASTLAKSGHEIFIFTPNYQRKDQIEKGNPKIYRIGFGKDTVFSRNNPISTRYFAKKIEESREEFELIDSYLWFTPGEILAKRLKLPFVCSIRDATPICDFRVDEKPKEYKFFEYFVKRFKTYGLSPRQIINAIYGFHITKKNLQIIFEANCLTFASRALAEIFDKYNCCSQVIYSVGLPKFKREDVKIDNIDFKKDRVVIYPGRLSVGKGAGFLFEAAKMVIKQDKTVKFIFIGEGELKDKISNKKFSEQIFCLGKRDYNFVLSLIEKSRVTVIPSLVFEGLPRSGVESISLGIPVIGTNVGGIGEAVGSAAILIEPGKTNQLVDAILKVCQNDNLYNKLKKQTKAQAGKFTPEEIAQKALDVYQRVLFQ